MFYGGLDTAVVDTTDDDRWLCEFDGEAIELNDLTAWRASQNVNTKIAETPIKDSDPLTEMLNEYNCKMVYKRESDEDDDDDYDDSDDDTMEECSECGWDPVYINADGSVDVTLSDAETDDIEDFISLLSESSKSNTPVKMTNLSKIAPWSLEEKSSSNQNYSSRVERPVVISPATCEFRDKSNFGSSEGDANYTPEKTSHMTLSLQKMNKSRQSQNLQLIPTKEQIEEDNRLRGGATIFARLPFRKSSELNKKILDRVKNSDSIQTKKEPTPPPTLLISKTQTQTERSQSNSTSSSSGYQIRTRRRNSENEVCRDAVEDLLVSVGPTCKCQSERGGTGVVRAPALCFKPQCEVKRQVSQRQFVIDDRLSQISPSSCMNSSTDGSVHSGSTSTSTMLSKKLHRSMSTTKITEELRAKLGLPQTKFDPELTPTKTQISIPSRDSPFSKQFGSFTPSTSRHCTAGTQTIPLTRFLSDSQVNSRMLRREICSRCLHPFCRQDGTFTCDSCVGVERVKNSLVLELYADKPQSSGTNVPRSGNTTCYGVRIGAGLLPVVVLLLSVIICSMILMSDSVMNNVCHNYCGNENGDSSTSSITSSFWWWLRDRYKS